MPSLQYYALGPVVRLSGLMTNWMAGRKPEDWTRFVQRISEIAERRTRLPRSLTYEQSEIAGVEGWWMRPPGRPDGDASLYFHGSGMVTALRGPLKSVGAYLAEASGVPLFAPDYSILPATYPAAHDECYRVYEALVAEGRRLVLVGDSSGGVLALATMLRARAAGLPQPALCLLLSPAVDFIFADLEGPRGKDPFVSARWVRVTHRAYMGDRDPTVADLSPISQDLTGLAPLHVLVGEQELSRGAVDRLEATAQRCGVPITVEHWRKMWHGWYVMADQLPEGRQALMNAGTTIRDFLASTDGDADASGHSSPVRQS